MSEQRLIELQKKLDGLRDELARLKALEPTTEIGLELRKGSITATGFQIDSALTEMRMLLTERGNMSIEDTIIVGVLQRADANLDRDTLRDTILERLALYDELIGAGGPVQVPAPSPTPAPTPAPEVPELDALWYLNELLDEFIRYKWPATIDGAKQHWRQYGKPQGRKGRADGPGWGPKAEDAPPGTVL